MALDLVSFIGSIENLIIKNNTTTSSNNVSSSLNKAVQKTFKGVQGMHEDLPVPVILYPVIFIELDTTANEFAQLGNSARREIDINFDIVAITHYGGGSANEGEGRENASNEVIQISQNIEGLIRANITLSSSADWCQLENVDYSSNVGEKTYNSISKISIQARKLSI